jgi:hypothetical protein
MTRSYFVALAFIRDEGDIVPGDAVECPNAMDAALQAQVLSHASGNIGVVAYSRTANDVGVFSEAVIIKKFGDRSQYVVLTRSKKSGPGFPRPDPIRRAAYIRPRCHRGVILSGGRRCQIAELASRPA